MVVRNPLGKGQNSLVLAPVLERSFGPWSAPEPALTDLISGSGLAYWLDPPTEAELRAQVRAMLAYKLRVQVRRIMCPTLVRWSARVLRLGPGACAAVREVARWAGGSAGDGFTRGLWAYAGNLIADFLCVPSDWVPAAELSAEGAFFARLARAARGHVAAQRRRHHELATRFELALQATNCTRFPPPPRATGDVSHAPTVMQLKALCSAAPFRIQTAVLFCGAGGVSAGLSLVPDFSVVLALDSWGAAADIYDANFVLTDVARVSVQDTHGFKAALDAAGRIDLAQYLPPCPDFSLSGRRIEGARAKLLCVATEVLTRCRIPVLLMENVVGVRSSRAGCRSEDSLRDAGYAFTWLSVEGSHCGTPQSRPHVWLLAILGGGAISLRRVEAAVVPLPKARLGRSMIDVVPGLAATFYVKRRSGKRPHVLPSDGLAPCIMSGRFGRLREGYSLRVKPPNMDAGPVAAASVLVLVQSGAALGFSPDYEWLEGIVAPVDIRRAQGNAVAPPMMAVLARILVECGVFAFVADADASPPPIPGPFLEAELMGMHSLSGGVGDEPAWAVPVDSVVPPTHFLMRDMALRACIQCQLRSTPLGGLPVRVSGKPQE